jgi:hypothetical protein
MKITAIQTICLLFLLFMGISLYAQPKINSPYSRRGFGDLSEQSFAQYQSMAGTCIAFSDQFHMNLVNPAAMAKLRQTSFEMGVFARYGKLSGTTSSAGVWSGNLGYIALAFPLQNEINKALERDKREWRFAMGMALQPYSVTGYNVRNPGFTSAGDTLTQLLQGNGGTYLFHWGAAAGNKNFSVGARLGYIFGRIENSNQTILLNQRYSYRDDVRQNFSLRGLLWRVGMQYDLNTRKPQQEVNGGDPAQKPSVVTFGMYAQTKQSINTSTFNLSRRVSNFSSYADTLINVSDVAGKATIPAEFGFGIAFKDFNRDNDERFKVGLDYVYTGWSGYTNDARPLENLKDAQRISAGVEWTKKRFGVKFSERVTYRAGVVYQTDPREQLNESLTRYGITLGVTLPLLAKERISFYHFGIEAGRIGGKEALTDTYARFTFGVTLNDNYWFLKRKFN